MIQIEMKTRMCEHQTYVQLHLQLQLLLLFCSFQLKATLSFLPESTWAKSTEANEGLELLYLVSRNAKWKGTLSSPGHFTSHHMAESSLIGILHNIIVEQFWSKPCRNIGRDFISSLLLETDQIWVTTKMSLFSLWQYQSLIFSKVDLISRINLTIALFPRVFNQEKYLLCALTFLSTRKLVT